MTTSDDMVDPGQAGKPDLDVWRSEAGAALATPFLGYSEAARTGWPRDAARVAVLCDRVAALEAHVATLDALKAIGDRQETLADRFAARCEVLETALGEALNGWDRARWNASPPQKADAETIARLRALAAGTAAAAEEEPAR